MSCFMLKLFHCLFFLQLEKPIDKEYDKFWIDFNTGGKRISIFCKSVSQVSAYILLTMFFFIYFFTQHLSIDYIKLNINIYVFLNFGL